MGRTYSMAFIANQRQQLCLEDSTYSLTERSKKMLKKSWVENFAQHIFPLINEDRFSVLYSTNQASRPNTPVNVIIGLLLLKEIFGSTDEELMETVLFDVRYQYALHTTRYQVDHMPVRGYIRTKCMYFLKVGAINVLRVLKAVSSTHLPDLLGRLDIQKISTPALFQVRIHREEFACT